MGVALSQGMTSVVSQCKNEAGFSACIALFPRRIPFSPQKKF